ncbi:hypothetical protein QFC21_005237 [Naganishia friedmannii]|uniref:Uncharacterized protein n=1 Tax=Naganishia friedmannii TaxID=89922 RepID=A0ACC2VAP2_9TREE|nr:hypothetical protein QFC21_005237 [Naganishia friedmannii]
MPCFRPEYVEIARLLAEEDVGDPITQCGQSVLHLLRNHASALAIIPFATSASSTATAALHAAHDAFTILLHLARQKTTQTAFHAVSAPWLRLYVDATLGLVIASAFTSLRVCEADADQAGNPTNRSCAWKEWVGMLDRAIIVAGAIGEGREEAVNRLIKLVQEDFAPRNWYEGVRKLAEIEKRNFKLSNGRKRRRSSEHLITHSSTANHHPPRFAPRPIPTYTSSPSIGTYLRTPDLLNRPFVIKGYATSSSSDSPTETVFDIPCPALTRWQSAAYLLQLTGPGRLVPVEVGSSYTSPEWGQRVVPWESFLEAVGYEMGSIPDVYSSSTNNSDSPSSSFVKDEDDAEDDNENSLSPDTPTYLAQHPLLTHFPALSNDLEAALSPEFIFSAPPPPEWFEDYVPPGCSEGIVRNVWVGSGGRKAKGERKDEGNGIMDSGEEGDEPVGPVVSPAHTVLGRKRVWVAPPSVSPEYMYAFSNAAAEDSEDARNLMGRKDEKVEDSANEGVNGDAAGVVKDTEQEPDDQPTTSSSRAPSSTPSNAGSDVESGLLTSYMTNTSRVPIFTPSLSIDATAAAVCARFPAFYKHAWPHSMEIVLEPGDLLVMPPKWYVPLQSVESCHAVFCTDTWCMTNVKVARDEE